MPFPAFVNILNSKNPQEVSFAISAGDTTDHSRWAPSYAPTEATVSRHRKRPSIRLYYGSFRVRVRERAFEPFHHRGRRRHGEPTRQRRIRDAPGLKMASLRCMVGNGAQSVITSLHHDNELFQGAARMTAWKDRLTSMSRLPATFLQLRVRRACEFRVLW